MTQSEYLRWLIERQLEGSHVPPGFVKVNLTLRDCVMEEMGFLARTNNISSTAEAFVVAAIEGLSVLLQKAEERTERRERLEHKQAAHSKEQAVSQRYVNP